MSLSTPSVQAKIPIYVAVSEPWRPSTGLSNEATTPWWETLHRGPELAKSSILKDANFVLTSLITTRDLALTTAFVNEIATSLVAIPRKQRDQFGFLSSGLTPIPKRRSYPAGIPAYANCRGMGVTGTIVC